MSRNDITLATPERHGVVRRHQVASGSAASIKAGEPVIKTLGAATVALAATNQPTVATDFFVGIAASDSTDTASAAGTVDVVEIDPRDEWLISPKVAATYGVGATPVQATYNALVGDRNLLDLTSSAWTILASDGSTYGCVIRDSDVRLVPGKVRFAFRAGVSYLT